MRKTLPVLRQRLGGQLDGHRYVRVVRHQSPQVQMRAAAERKADGLPFGVFRIGNPS